jgi:hypothetical protein
MPDNATTHPSGNAVDTLDGNTLDFMTDVTTGDVIAALAIDNWDDLGVEYLVWRGAILRSPRGKWERTHGDVPIDYLVMQTRP